MDPKLIRLSRKLEAYHSIFSRIWSVGRITWTDKIPTAAVTFNRSGNFLSFLFNPKFYASLNDDELCFIIAHECLHILLNHGVRGKGLDPTAANYAMDLVINESLTTTFGFSRELPICEKLIFQDVMEEKFNCKFREEQNFEYYYPKCEEYIDSLPKIFITLDEHGNLPEETLGEIERKIGKLSEEEKKIFDRLKEEVQRAKTAGEGSSFNWASPELVPARKVTWEKFIAKELFYGYKKNTQNHWKMPNRKLACIKSKDLLLPELGNDKFWCRKYIDTVFYMDCSGSCAHLVNTFRATARLIPKDRFRVEAYAFDTEVTRLKLGDDEVPYGGGTAFHQLEENLLNRQRYPELVFVMTDGAGTIVKPKFPKRWHVFLTEGGSQGCFEGGVNFHEFRV